MSRVWISIAHHDALVREAARMVPNETGGALVGYRGEGGDLVITTIIGPGPKALHEKTRFVPDHAYQDEKIARLYKMSGRQHVYLGDWHSHPGGSCALSRTDRRTLRRIARAKEARIAEPVMIVIGGGPVEWRTCAFRIMRHSFFRVVRTIRIVSFG